CSDALVKYNIFRKYSSAKIIRWNHSQISSKDSKKMARVYSYYDRIIAISYEMAGRLISDLNLQTEKIISIYNPINLEDIKAKSEQSIPEDLEKDYLLTVTRLVDGKGLFELIEIYKQLKENGIRNKLYIIGNGELKNELQKKIEEFSLEKDCILLGARTNPYPYFKRAKLFLFTSESEGLGLVLLESIALGTPVISMNCPTGPTEIIGKNNEYGKLIQLHDKDGFCSAVYELLHNPTLYQSYIEKSLERGADFSKENIEINIKHLFHQLYNNGLPKP
ncbi:TPA: glycosyltransferase, partial [Mannheimia haemolytica]